MSKTIYTRFCSSISRLLENRAEAGDRRLAAAVKSCRFEQLEPRRLMNAAPIAANDTFTVGAGVSVLNVLANDSDPDLDTLAILSTTAPAHGTVVNYGNSLQYTANYTYHGTDSFTYTVFDSLNAQSTATVNLTVSGIGLDYDPSNIGGPRTAVVAYGTTGNDTIQFAELNGSIIVRINGVQQASSYPVVSSGLTRLVAYGDIGNDSILTTAGLPVLFYGEAGNDSINGGSASDILIGGAGNDNMTGSSGRDFLFGGAGGDTISGGAGDDILVSASTSYDGVSTANHQNLYAMMREWSSTATFSVRTGHIRGTTTGGLNGSVVLNNSKIQEDGVIDFMTGGADQDLFFAVGGGETKDKASDVVKTDMLVKIM
jgi:Ca2+-binding RTX toxin-like protein